MNMAFNPYHLGNTYGAFGSIGRIRLEVVIEGTDEPEITEQTVWKEYGFKGKPERTCTARHTSGRPTICAWTG